MTRVFYAVCALGAALSLALGIAEATSTPAVKVGPVQHTTVGLRTTVSATLTDQVSTPRCPQVRVAALDSQSRTLASAIANSAVLQPKGSATFTGVLTMTAKQYREDVSKYIVYVYSEHRCR